MWRDLAPVGRSASSGGYFRQPWASAETELRAWFAAECAARGLTVETDGIGNQVAWWSPESGVRARACSPARTSTPSSTAGRTTARWASCPRWPRSTCCASAASSPPARSASRSSSRRRGRASAAPASARGWSPARPPGTRRASCATATGSSSATRSPPPAWTRRRGCCRWTGSATFVELHVEQGRDLVDRDVAVGLASEIWPHGRWRFDFAGQANHAGTTRMEDRHDPMLTYAMTALAANKQARLAGQRATFGRISVEPNGTNAVPSLVTAWLDARASSDDALAEMVGLIAQAGRRARRPRRHLAGRDAPSRCRARWPSTPTWPPGSPGSATGRSSRPRPATTPASCPTPASPPRWSSCATPPASRTRPTSTPRWPTAWPASRPSPTCWPSCRARE